jgi:hypothetical protein
VCFLDSAIISSPVIVFGIVSVAIVSLLSDAALDRARRFNHEGTKYREDREEDLLLLFFVCFPYLRVFVVAFCVVAVAFISSAFRPAWP